VTFERFLVPIYLPRPLYESTRKIKRIFVPPHTREGIDLSGDRDIEWSFIASRIKAGPGEALDFGCYSGNLSILAAQYGYRVVGVDLEPHRFPFQDPNVEFVRGDVNKLELPLEKFDLILNCSTIEHVGLAGRYGIAAEETNGDLAAMRKLQTLMKASGRMLLTLPCGQDAVMAPWHRVYGRQRLPLLLEGYKIEEQQFWVKQKDNRWMQSDRETALSFPPTGHPTVAVYCSYALACFVLRKEAAPASKDVNGAP
jgi:SAM-dependent methyltransferase